MGKNNHQSKERIAEQFVKLVEIMRRLLAPEGCPWDKQQTHKSLKPYLIEEAYEVIESIDAENSEELKEELGDLLLQIVFHSELAHKEGKFDIGDVLESICQKMIHRHPHVFGKERWDTPEEVLRNWECLKQSEREQKQGEEHVSILEGIPRSLPSLIRAHRLQDRAARVGFDWNHIEEVYAKVTEELEELRRLMKQKNANPDRIEDEFGDLLFALVNLARFLKIHPEEALQHTNEKFIRRFSFIEEQARNRGKDLSSMTLEEMDALWEQAKSKEQNK
ncbi:nucleoside triphosphate pyrophosphohydrolase [Candidatus Sumerlaeota bacterium]|nr:nucleoside triphosphate pyrophosphohydrolase [Candidatus Sumerlaeota bacterium]